MAADAVLARENLLAENRLPTVFYGAYLTGHTIVSNHAQSENIAYVRQGIALGKGQFGTIYLEHLQNESASAPPVRAVKEIGKVFSKQNDIDWKREVEVHILLSTVKHADLFVRFHGWYDNQDTVFLAQEYFALGDLSRYVRDIGQEDDIRIISRQLVDGLAFMHDMHLVHRDIKPSNIFVAATGPMWQVKIADFGCAKHRIENTGLWSSRGTQGYTAPEYSDYIRNSSEYPEPTPAVDWWSLGCIIFELFVKETPFKNQYSVFKAYCDHPILPEDIFTAGASPEAQRALARFLDPAADTRITAEEAKSMLWLSDLPEAPKIDDDLAGEMKTPEIQLPNQSADVDLTLSRLALHTMPSDISLASTATLVNGASNVAEAKGLFTAHTGYPAGSSGANTPRMSSPGLPARKASVPPVGMMSSTSTPQTLSPSLPPRRTSVPLPSIASSMNSPRLMSPMPMSRESASPQPILMNRNRDALSASPALPPRRPSLSPPGIPVDHRSIEERPPSLPPRRPSVPQRGSVSSASPQILSPIPVSPVTAAHESFDTSMDTLTGLPTSNDPPPSYRSPTAEEVEDTESPPPLTRETTNGSEYSSNAVNLPPTSSQMSEHNVFTSPLTSCQSLPTMSPVMPMTSNESNPGTEWQSTVASNLVERPPTLFKCQFRQQELLFGFRDVPCQLDFPPHCDLCEERERLVGPRGRPGSQIRLFDCETCGKGRILCERCASEAINRPGDPHQADHILRQVGPAWSFQFNRFMTEHNPSPEIGDRTVPSSFLEKWLGSDHAFRSPSTTPPCKFLRVVCRLVLPVGTYQLAAHLHISFDKSRVSSEALGTYQKKMMKLSKAPYGHIAFGAELVSADADNLGPHTRYMPDMHVQKDIFRQSAVDDFSLNMTLTSPITVGQGQAIEVSIRSSYDVQSFKQGCPYWWYLNYIGLSQFGQKTLLASRGQIIRRENFLEQQADLDRRAKRERNINYTMRALGAATAAGGLYQVVEGISANRAKKRNNEWGQYNHMVQARNGLTSDYAASEAASVQGNNELLAQQQYDAGLAQSGMQGQGYESSRVQQWVNGQENQSLTFESMEYAVGNNAATATYTYTRI